MMSITSEEEHQELKTRIIQVLSSYSPWIWNDPAKVFVLVWKGEIKLRVNSDPKLLSAEGFLNCMWREIVTEPEKIYEVFKELQSINGNNKSLTLNMQDTTEKVPHRVPVLAHLQKGMTLTGLEAWRMFGCYRLSSVIGRLNEKPDIEILCTIPKGEQHGIYFIPQEDKAIS